MTSFPYGGNIASGVVFQPGQPCCRLEAYICSVYNRCVPHAGRSRRRTAGGGSGDGAGAKRVMATRHRRLRPTGSHRPAHLRHGRPGCATAKWPRANRGCAALRPPRSPFRPPAVAATERGRRAAERAAGVAQRDARYANPSPPISGGGKRFMRVRAAPVRCGGCAVEREK